MDWLNFDHHRRGSDFLIQRKSTTEVKLELKSKEPVFDLSCISVWPENYYQFFSWAVAKFKLMSRADISLKKYCET